MNRFTKIEQQKLMSDCPRVFKSVARKFKSREYEEDLKQQAFELMLVLLRNYRDIQTLQEFFKLYKASCFYYFSKKTRSRKREEAAFADFEYIQSEHFEAEISKRFLEDFGEET